ncbi:E3 ubiquitin-protein ligase ZNRF1-like isoform X1 [Limulus polyphemus]|uniref:RING-type E3 ubiquitin transferase n=1 Tax=Limulus polyphemus TaxID=6850 RepID=A0ABM1BXP5_LIMPO|nr:E3 ubiquitin-protein ligase ZNRF1-like isoform X1 [Limulus polyphemus]XP_022235493.1 E3 ubiquitin-protein ligase ZNRF1-like isoform X1 [Limulus polyphemus]
MGSKQSCSSSQSLSGTGDGQPMEVISDSQQTGSNIGGRQRFSSGIRQRTRSLTNVGSGQPEQVLGLSSVHGAGLGGSRSPDSDFGSPDEMLSFTGMFSAHSLPIQLLTLNGIKCPVCSKIVVSDDVEYHLVMCLTKPRLSYNDDILHEDKGECVICLEDLVQGDTIARLPCLCIYHKICIDNWFQVNRSCPEHPND